MSAPQSTTAEALRAALASTIACSAQELQEAVGQVVVATAAELPASAPAGADARSVFDPQARTTVLLADRIPAGQEAQALAEEIERHHGRQVAQAILGDRADELLGVAGAEVLNELAGQFQSGYPEDPRTTFRYVRDQLLTYASDRRHFNVPAWEFLKEMDASQQQAFILSKVVPVLRDAEWPKEGSEQLQEALLAVVGKYWSNPATTAVLQAGRIPADGGDMEQSRQSGYVIRLLGESETDLDGSAGEFWSNEDGWGSLKGATLFTASERQSFHLPIFQERESEWISIERARDLVSGRPPLEEVPVEPVLGDSAAELLGGDGKVKKTDAERLNDYVVAFEVGRLVSRGAINDGTFDGQRLSASKHALSTPNEDVVSECLRWWDDAIKSGLLVERNLSNYFEQAPVVLTVTPDELGIVQAAVQEYRELIASPTSADREARGNVWADREVAASDALLDGKLAVAARRFRTSHEVSNYTGFTQDVLNALASEHRMTPGAISVSSDGTKSVVLERDNVDDLYCQAILTVHSSGAVACHTGLYRERAIINNGSVTEPSVEVAIANASAVFDDLIVRHAEVRKEENYQSPGM